MKDYSLLSNNKIKFIEFVEIKNRYATWLCECDKGHKFISHPHELLRKRAEKTIKCNECRKLLSLNRYKSYVGKKYNKITIKRYLGNKKYEYQCECGVFGRIEYDNLDHQISCGCIQNLVKIGKINKNYKVIETFSDTCTVVCLVCNSERTIQKSAFRQKNTHNCTCKTSYNVQIPIEDRKWFTLFNNYKSLTERRGVEFKLTLEEYKSLVTKNCHYCHSEPVDFKYKNRLIKGKKNGIDRVNSKIGYIIDNCVPCCYTCNVMKSDQTLDEFKTHIKKINDFYLKE